MEENTGIQLPKDQITQQQTGLKPLPTPNVSLPEEEWKLPALMLILTILAIFCLGVITGLRMSLPSKTAPIPPAPTPVVVAPKRDEKAFQQAIIEARLAALERRLDAKRAKQVPIAAPAPVAFPVFVEPFVPGFGPGIMTNGVIGLRGVGIRPIVVRRKGVTIRRRVR